MITHIDVLSNKKYNFEAAKEHNGEYRLYGVRQYLLEDNNAIEGDIVKISRKEDNDNVIYHIELLSSFNVFWKRIMIKLSKIVYGKKELKS